MLQEFLNSNREAKAEYENVLNEIEATNKGNLEAATLKATEDAGVEFNKNLSTMKLQEFLNSNQEAKAEYEKDTAQKPNGKTRSTNKKIGASRDKNGNRIR